MRVLFATSSFRGGGITSYAVEVINSFSAEHDFSVLIGDDKKMPITKDGVRVYYCENSDISIENAKKALRLINEDIKPDVILSSNSRIISFIAPYLLDSIKLITVSHSQKYAETDTAAYNSRYIDTIIALSRFNKAYIDRRFIIKDPQKTKVVYNFVRGVEGVEERIRNKKKQNPLRILFMGGSSGSKSPDIVFRIMTKLSEANLPFRFYWLGSDLFTLGNLLPFQHVSSFFEGDDRFVFTGRVTRDKALAICAEANILLIPSRREGCPMAMLETMRTGVISITSDFKNACQELVENNVTGMIIPHNDIDGFVNTVTSIIKFHQGYASFYESSYKFFQTNLSYEKWKERMDLIMLNNEVRHHHRRKKFSLILFELDTLLFSLLNLQNRVDHLFHERIKPVVPFVKRYYSLKRHKNNLD